MRILKDWVDEFMRLTDHLPSPELFRKWGAISAIAGVLERKVWVRTMKMELYPNLYVILTGPPATGKSVVASRVEDLWRSIQGLHVAPKSVSKASLMDSLAEAKRSKVYINGNDSKHLNFNSLLVNAGELGVFIPTYDSEFMNALTYIWDGEPYEEKRRSKDLHINIPKPQLNILGGTTPSYLNATIPEGAWDQGFLSRTFLIFSGEGVMTDIFSEESPDENKQFALRSDLRAISDLIGQFAFLPEAMEAIREWHLAGGPPRPDHPKLVYYVSRRTQQLLKLCMIASASRSDERIITGDDYLRALGWLLEAEVSMEDIFKAIASRGDGKIMEEAWHFLYKVWTARQEPIAEHRLINFLSEQVPAYNVMRIIEMMERGHQIQKGITNSGMPGWTPLGKRL
jgi:hypothetical protein